MQIIGYNGDLYVKEEKAMMSPNGVVAIAVFLEIGETPNHELRKITDAAAKIKYAGERVLFDFSTILRIHFLWAIWRSCPPSRRGALSVERPAVPSVEILATERSRKF